MPNKQKPDSTVADSSKRPASGFHQLKTAHCLTGQYLNWTKSRSTAQCWWCPCRTQTRDHFFKACPKWKAQRKILWTEVREESERGKSQFEIRDPPRRCEVQPGGTRLPLCNGCGRLVPAEEDAGGARCQSGSSESAGSGKERRAEAEELGADGEEQPLFLPTPSFMASAEEN